MACRGEQPFLSIEWRSGIKKCWCGWSAAGQRFCQLGSGLVYMALLSYRAAACGNTDRCIGAGSVSWLVCDAGIVKSEGGKGMNTYQIEGLSFSYPEQEQPALKQMDLTIEQGAFVVLCGSSGSGKSTLLRQLKPLLAPHGKRTGTILFEGRPIEQMDQRMQSQQIGFVMQSPDNQIVTDKVWHELAFGLESLGVPGIEIRRRVAEMASFFGIQNWFYKDVQTLSGGQNKF